MIAAHGLMEELMAEGVDTFHLGVYDANRAAWPAYKALGFVVVEKRPLGYLDAPAPAA